MISRDGVTGLKDLGYIELPENAGEGASEPPQ